MKNRVFILLLLRCLISYGQDTIYARKIIKDLTSTKYLGRGYVNDGVNKAAAYITKEMKTIGLNPFGKSFSQPYTFDVNTFPNTPLVKLDGKKLIPGNHYLIYPDAKSLKANFDLVKKDSATYVPQNGTIAFQVKLKKKLTYTVATETSKQVVLELLKDSFPGILKNIEVSFKNKFITNYTCQNLCGYIKGTQQPDTFIMFTAHYDHLGAMGKTTYFPGANDNASGVSLLLNLANYYKKNPPKHSIAFIFFSGEEAGLLGSKYYSENPLFPLNKIKFLINLDLLGTGDEGVTIVNATIFKEQFALLNKINIEKNYVKQIKQRGKAANSDHYWFTEKNVPSFFLYTTGGIQAYHDIYDINKTLPLTDYMDVCNLLIDFTSKL